jgi:hypothetical protein
MQWHDVDVRDLLATCRRELSRREWVYPKRVAEGTMKDTKATAEIEEMRAVVEFLVHCVFRAVVRNRSG